MKLKLYPVVIVALPIILTFILVLGSFRFSISIEPVPPGPLPLPEGIALPKANRSVPSQIGVLPAPPIWEETPPSPTSQPLEQEPTATPTPEKLSNDVTVPDADASSPTNSQGQLRVSNLTEHPVRIALLLWQSKENQYSKPAHWDFAPEEGGSKGLILSLPEGTLKLQPTDIIVAFAQDGSRRYWGPYVVGKTSLPVWNSKTGEWQLILRS